MPIQTLTAIITPAEFEQWVFSEEALELSEAYDPSATVVDTAKIQQAIDLAEGCINGYYVVSPPCGKALILLKSKYIALVYTRKFLDIVKDRESVNRDYEEMTTFLKEARDWEGHCPLSDEELEDLGVTPENARGLPKVVVSSEKRIWTRKKLEPFVNQEKFISIDQTDIS